jgi:D-aspartate ligase
MIPSHSQNSVPALLLGTGVTVLGVMRCLGRKHIPLYCLSEKPEMEAYSRWRRTFPQKIREFGETSDLERVLETVPLREGVLIGCSDQWAIEVSRLGAALRDRFHACLPRAGVIRRFVNKGGLAELLETANLPRPPTQIARSEQDILDFSKRSSEGLFLKPTESQRFLATFRKKAFWIEDTEAALSVFRRAREAGLTVMVQEYIPGPSDRHYFVDGFVDRSHSIHAWFARRRMRMHPRDFGNSSFMISVPPEEVSGAVEALRTLFRAGEYRGIFSAEFKLDERDGLFKLLEVNCRPWWYIQFAADCGVDVAEMAYRDALGQELPEPRAYKVGARMVYPLNDYHALRDSGYRGTAFLKALLSSWPGAADPEFSWDDPLPAVVDFVKWAAAKLRP